MCRNHRKYQKINDLKVVAGPSKTPIFSTADIFPECVDFYSQGPTTAVALLRMEWHALILMI